MKFWLNDFTKQTVFASTFLFAIAAGLILQLFILPVLLPALHGGNGLLVGGDWVLFHAQALQLVNKIQQEGWGAWGLVDGNALVGVTAAIYELTGVNKPLVILPINALLFALTAMCFFEVFLTITTKRWAFFATLPFVLFPSAVQLYGQIHKDVWVAAGYGLFLVVWVRFSLSYSLGYREFVTRCFMIIFAIGLIWIARPYFIQIMILTNIVVIGVIVVQRWHRREVKLRIDGKLWSYGLLVCLVLPLVLTMVFKAEVQDALKTVPETVPETVHWQSARWMPSFLDDRLKGMGQSRFNFAHFYPDAGSNIDTDVVFESAYDIFRYIPRAMQVALFSPFPESWQARAHSHGGNIMRVEAAGETLFAYAALVGVILLLVFSLSKRKVSLVVIVSTIVPLLMMALVVCNVGTLYRMRYVYWQVLIGLGVVGWSLVGQSGKQRASGLVDRS